MKASSIVNRIKAVLATYTEGFSNLIDINTLTCATTTITANTINPHGLNTGDYVTIKGAKEPITLTTLTRSDNIVTAVSATDHKLIDPSKYSAQWLPIMVEISGANPAEYNGSFKLLTVADDNTFTFEITTTPASPAVAAGQLLLKDESGYNGYKQITVTTPNDFTYSTLQTLQSPAAGTIKMSVATKVSGVASPNNIVEYYNKNGAGVLDDRIFVYIDDDVVYRNDTVGNDISSQQNSNLDYFYQLQESFSIFVVTPGKDSLQGIQAADRARSYRVPLLKAIANFQFESDLTDTNYQPAYYTGSSTDDYIKAFYVQRFDFGAITYIQNSDVNQDSNSSLLKEIDAIEIAKDLEIKVDF